MSSTTTVGNLIGGPLTDIKLGPLASEVSLGPTLAPLTYRKETTTREYRTQQQKGPLKEEESTVVYYVSTVLAHITLENLRVALNQASGNLSGSTLTIDEDALGEQSLVCEGPAPNGGTRTITFPKVSSISTGEASIDQEAQQGVPVEFKVLQDASNGKFYQYVDAA